MGSQRIVRKNTLPELPNHVREFRIVFRGDFSHAYEESSVLGVERWIDWFDAKHSFTAIKMMTTFSGGWKTCRKHACFFTKGLNDIEKMGTEERKVDLASLQGDSSGVHFSRSDGKHKYCEWGESAVLGKDEKYIFPCDLDLDCCGNRCCDPAPGIMPLWLIILLILLLLLLLCICCGIMAWIWYKCRPKKEKFVPSPMDVEFLPAPKSQAGTLHREDEISRSQKVFMGNSVSTGTQKAQIAYYRPFEPSPMAEIEVPRVPRLKAQSRDVAEISAGQKPNISHIKTPDSQHAQQVYIRPAFDNVPAYN